MPMFRRRPFFPRAVARTAPPSLSATVEHSATGALTAQAATVSGAALHPHTSTGALEAQAAAVAGSATLTPLPVTHATTGALAAGSATVSGVAAGSGVSGGGSYGEARKRFVVKVGNKLVVTNSAQAATRLIESQSQKKKQTEPESQGTAHEAQETEDIAEEVPIPEIRAVANTYGAQTELAPLFQQKDYEGVLALYNLLKQREDDEEIELLLMAI